jgi:hypothetical protein
MHDRDMTVDEKLRIELRAAAELPAALDDLLAATLPAAIDEGLADWQLRAATALVRVEVCWAAHVRADDRPDGFLAHARHEAPRLSHEIDLELAEHGLVSAALRDVHDAVIAVREGADLPAVEHRIAEEVRAVRRHLDNGNCLARAVVGDEFGSGD